MMFPTPAPLFTERLCLRVMEARDVAALQGFYTDPLYLRFLPNRAWSSLADGEAWFARIDARRAEGLVLQFVIESRSTQELMGICLVFNPDEASQRAEIGYALGPAFWGQGFGAEALRELISFAFLGVGLRRLDATVDPRNPASSKLLLDAGFRYEGTRRDYGLMKDELVSASLYGLLRTDWRP